MNTEKATIGKGSRETSKKRNYLLRVYSMQSIYQKEKRPGVVDMWIYRTHIQPVFCISERTFREWLTISVKKEMRLAGIDPDTVLA